jgi:translation initiation factor IF-2
LVTIPRVTTVHDLSDYLRLPPVEIIKGLLRRGVMASINQVIDYETAAAVANDLGYQTVEEIEQPKEVAAISASRRAHRATAGGITRPPVVTIMGHVDHGKTSLLDAIRQSNVTAGEAGGITQHIGAYQVEVDGHKITFVDTPGHEAFTSMRARGAHVTDVAVIVVAADDGVMPQTVEAINHAKAAGVPLIVAINKMDRPEANPERVKRQLAENNVLIEEYGGDVVAVPVSARTRDGLPGLLEHILLVAEIEELTADPNRRAEGVVLEAHLDAQRGPMATMLVQAGTLHIGNLMVIGETSSHVRAMYDDRNHQIKTAGPSTPVKILGLGSVPDPGDLFLVSPDEKSARALVEQRQRARQAHEAAPTAVVSLAGVFEAVKSGVTKDLNVVLKTDVQGSIDPLRASLAKLGDEHMRVNLLHAAAGAVSESDVMLAVASKGIVLGFNTRVDLGARRAADTAGVEIRTYDVIYALVDEVEKALKGLLEPEIVEVVEGRAEVRQVFTVGRRSAIAGSQVIEGRAMRNAQARVLRAGKVVADERVAGLKRFKDDAREVATGLECGITLESFQEFEVGDIIEFYRKETQKAG